MGILDSYKDLINASFSKWIKVEDKQSKWTIEDFMNTWSCYTIFPNGKLKLNTIIGGK
jgi:hypothetical protein